MSTLRLLENGELGISATATSSMHDFDFFAGKWNIHNRKLKQRLNDCKEWLEFDATGETQIILHGLGNTDNFITSFEGQPFEGRTFRLFNPLTRLWSIYWADSNNGKLDTPVVGSFDRNIGQFYCKDIYNDKPVLVMFRWDKTDPGQPVWSQAFSPDGGNTWEWNWYMYMTKRDL